jgi:FkbM family methyltransferase
VGQPANSTLIEGVQGFSMYVDNGDSPISGSISGGKVWEVAGTQVVKDNFKPGQTFVDAGAHFGYYSLLAAKLGAKRVVAFEPFKHNYEFLVANVEVNGFQGVIETHPAPLWESRAQMRMSQGGGNTGDVSVHFDELPNAPLDLTSEVLDELFEPDTVDFVKLDCQGADYTILLGAKRLLKESLAMKLMMEKMFGVYGHTEEEFYALMEESGFRQESWLGGEGTYYYVKG